jgi:hypothetical protein
MFKFSFKKLSQDNKKPEEFPLITSLNFGELSTDVEIQGEPIYCGYCSSALSNLDHLSKSGEKYVYKCEFCLKENLVPKDQAELMLGKISASLETSTAFTADLAFLLDQIRKDEGEILSKLEIETSTAGFPIQVAIIDVSGSMGGGKIEAVKHALVQNVHQITADYPKTDFILIPFSSNVSIYPNPQDHVEISDGPIFFKESKMENEVAKIVEKFSFQPIEKVYEKWTAIVKNMRTLNMTALGPGLFMGINMIIAKQKSHAKKAGGKVLLLTDGLANVGLGSVGSNKKTKKEQKEFYSRIAELCLQNNIVVDMVAVRDKGGGNSVALDIIGKVTDFTGGQMLFITADQVESAFGDFHRTSYIARNVILRVFSPDFLRLDEIQGAEVLQSLDAIESGTPIKLGAFYADRELYLKFKQKKTKLKPGTKIPVQIQLEYLDKQDHRRMRIFKQEIEITADIDSFKKEYNPTIATAYELSKASKLRSKGDFKYAEAQVQATMQRNVALGAQFDADFGILNELVEDEMDEWKAEEAEAESQNIADKQSFYAAKGQKRYRSSYDAKMKRMKKKKK